MKKLMYTFVATRKEKKNKMPATLALRVMLGLIHLFQKKLSLDFSSKIDRNRPLGRFCLNFILFLSQYKTEPSKWMK